MMEDKYKVRLSNVNKCFPVNQSKFEKVSTVLMFWKVRKQEKLYFSLNNVSFEVMAGDSVGLVGLNGAGKSTLSNLLGGVTTPTSGTVEINGKSSLIAISAGLNNALTGEENIKMKCLMHGLTQEVIDQKFEDIVNFSELGDFIKKPIKTYSSGMKARLGFAIAVHTDPDVLIVDEALSVGDDTFSNKCIERMKQFQKQGKTIFFVSHSVGQIQRMCNKAIWIHYGEVKKVGDCIPVVGLYARFIREYNQWPKEKQLSYKEEETKKQIKDASILPEENSERSWKYFFNLAGVSLLFATGVLSQLNIIPLTHLINQLKSLL